MAPLSPADEMSHGASAMRVTVTRSLLSSASREAERGDEPRRKMDDMRFDLLPCPSSSVGDGLRDDDDDACGGDILSSSISSRRSKMTWTLRMDEP
jgi:hypothetical protein